MVTTEPMVVSNPVSVGYTIYATGNKYNHCCGYNYYLFELNHLMRKYLDGGVTEANGRAGAPVGPSVAMPLPAILPPPR